MMNCVSSLLTSTLGFMKDQELNGENIGRYRYSNSCSAATLYSSSYAAMTRSLYNDLETLSSAEKAGWAEYLNSYQDNDGLFRDPVIFGQGWYESDPLWCGRSHLTCHVVTALACLGSVAAKPISFLDFYKDPDRLVSWLESRNWDERIGWSGNEIMNIGTLMQYERDFHGDNKAGGAILVLLEWLSENHIDRNTGVWGALDTRDPIWRSHAVQAAYHWWPLFFYDNYPVPYMERAIDTLLLTQNPQGGFGWGVHNLEEPYHSSACEDIDSIDPLARMTQKTAYRREDIRKTLGRAADWVLQNRTEDGGFVFLLNKDFEYGHRELYGERNGGAMFPTWFRTLSLAMLGSALPEHFLGEYPWQFVRCPGYQFR